MYEAIIWVDEECESSATCKNCDLDCPDRGISLVLIKDAKSLLQHEDEMQGLDSIIKDFDLKIDLKFFHYY